MYNHEVYCPEIQDKRISYILCQLEDLPSQNKLFFSQLESLYNLFGFHFGFDLGIKS